MLEILWQDELLVAINKPSGLLVHRSAIDRYETRFAMQLLRDQLGQHVWPLHRLDKPTSGVLLFGLSAEAARLMATQFEQHAIRKSYLAIVRGYTLEQAVIDYPLKEIHDKMTDKLANQDKEAQQAVTAYRRLATAELDVEIEGHATSRYSLVRCIPSTGRKHQIRRHMKHISHPIIGDARFGRGRHNRWFAENLEAGRLLLHAETLGFTHPQTAENVEVLAPCSGRFMNAVNALSWNELFDGGETP
jgi:tRNA pseudouridine65 synthase